MEIEPTNNEGSTETERVLISAEETALILQISVDALRKRRWKKQEPYFVKVGPRAQYDRDYIYGYANTSRRCRKGKPQHENYAKAYVENMVILGPYRLNRVTHVWADIRTKHTGKGVKAFYAYLESVFKKEHSKNITSKE